MASNYPTSLDSLATNKADGTATATDHAAHHNDLADAVNKIEAELGTNPSGYQTTVKERLNHSNYKTPCTVASPQNTNINIASAPSTIDGYGSLFSGDRVLLKNQTNATQNGIYIYNGAGSAMTLADDNDSTLTISYVPVIFGDENEATLWRGLVTSYTRVLRHNSSLSVSAGSYTAEIVGQANAAAQGHILIDKANSAFINRAGSTGTHDAFIAGRAADTAYRFNISIDGSLGWADGTNAVDTNLYRSAANTLKTDDTFIVGVTGGNKTELQITSTTANTGLTIGADTNLYRSAADTLKTDDAFIAGATSANKNQITIPDTTAGAGLTIGADTNLYRSAANTLKTDDAFVSDSSITGASFATSGTVTLGGDAELSRGAANVITVGTGDKIQQAAVPTVDNDLTNKAYVDGERTAIDGGGASVNYIFSVAIDGGLADFNFLTAYGVNGGAA